MTYMMFAEKHVTGEWQANNVQKHVKLEYYINTSNMSTFAHYQFCSKHINSA